jgi:hypothetical protein
VGIEPGVLDLLKKHNLTTVADLCDKLSLHKIDTIQKDLACPQNVGEVLDALPDNNALSPTLLVSQVGGMDEGMPSSSQDRKNNVGTSHAVGYGYREAAAGVDRSDSAVTEMNGGGRRAVGGAGGRPFVSYVAVHRHDENPDPDGPEYMARMSLEEKAISFILQSEPSLLRTEFNNPGFDLFEIGSDGQPARWVEVKAMSGGLQDRPVGLSRAQFECAREHGVAYWLYVVEYADDSGARIRRIQDPAGRARTFIFDNGWTSIAETDEEKEDF